MTKKNENTPQQTAGGAQTLNRTLSLTSLIFYGLAFMVPLTIFTTYGLATTTTHGMVSLTYVVTTVCMAFTAFSYVRMTKAYPVAGSVYTFVHKSINPHLGFLSGWVILIGYMFLPMLNYLVSAMYLSSAIPQVPEWVWIISMIAIVTVVNHFGIKVTDIFNKGIVWLQIIFLVVFIIITLKYILGGGGSGTLLDVSAFINTTELLKEDMGVSVLFTGASILALSYLGFDAISTLSEEAINPEKNIGRAIIIACVGAGSVFVILTYILQQAWPTAWMDMADPDNSYEVIQKVAGAGMAYFFTAAYSIGCIASSISSVASASRVLYGMGRDQILPKRIFGYLNPKRQTPTYSILIMAIVSLAALVISLTVATSLLNFGALLGFTMVNVSVIAHYFVRGKQRKGMDIVRYLIAPLLGAAFTFTIWINLDSSSMILGFAWLFIGVIYLAWTTRFFKKLPAEMTLE